MNHERFEQLGKIISVVDGEVIVHGDAPVEAGDESPLLPPAAVPVENVTASSDVEIHEVQLIVKGRGTDLQSMLGMYANRISQPQPPASQDASLTHRSAGEAVRPVVRYPSEFELRKTVEQVMREMKSTPHHGVSTTEMQRTDVMPQRETTQAMRILPAASAAEAEPYVRIKKKNTIRAYARRAVTTFLVVGGVMTPSAVNVALHVEADAEECKANVVCAAGNIGEHVLIYPDYIGGKDNEAKDK